MKKYLILLAHAPDAWTSASPDQREQWHGEHVQFHREVAGNLLAGEALESADTATKSPGPDRWPRRGRSRRSPPERRLLALRLRRLEGR